MKPDPADSFAPVLSSVETGNLVRVEFECLPGRGHGPAGMATVQGVVVEVLKDVGDPEGTGRYFRSLRLRDGSGDETTDYRFDYRGTTHAEAWLREDTGEDAFDGSAAWGKRRRVYALEVEGQGITARRERPGHSFVSVPTTENE